MNLLVLALVAQAAQAAPLPLPDSSSNTAAAAAQQVAHAAQQLRGDATIAAVLQTVSVRRDDAEHRSVGGPVLQIICDP